MSRYRQAREMVGWMLRLLQGIVIEGSYESVTETISYLLPLSSLGRRFPLGQLPLDPLGQLPLRE